MNLKEIQDNAPDGATHYYINELLDVDYLKDFQYVWIKRYMQWQWMNLTEIGQEQARNFALPLYPTPKEKEEMKTYGEYTETSYNCGATSSAKISVNSGNHTTTDILNERQEQYGNYSDVARITQEIKESLTSGDSYHVLSDEQKLSLDMIANKMARAVNGNVRYVDNWADICGYSQLVVDSLKREG